MSFPSLPLMPQRNRWLNWIIGVQRGLLVLIFLVSAVGCNPEPASKSADVLTNTATLMQAHSVALPQLNQTFGQMPLYFVENGGQVDDQVAFTLQSRNQTIYFTPQGITFALNHVASQPPAPSTLSKTGDKPVTNEMDVTAAASNSRWAVKLDFVGANPSVHPMGQEQLETRVSYFKGHPKDWHTGLRTFSRVVYADLWPGIDLVYYANADTLKYEFVVAPGADPDQIRLNYRGASDIRLNAAGQLELITPVGGFTDGTPQAYQEVNGQRVDIEMDYALDWNLPGILPPLDESGTQARSYGFRIGQYDPNQQLVLDPAIVVYAGYIGGAADDGSSDIAVDANGNAYVVGSTASDQGSFPVMAGPDLSHNGGGYDAYVAKVNAAGTGLVYASYIGGDESDIGFDVAVDVDGNAYIAGYTFSDQSSFPNIGGLDPTYNGGGDAFVAKLNSAGTGLDYVGYIGGTGTEYAAAIAVDDSGNAYLTGYVGSDEFSFPEVGGPDLTYNGGYYDAFVAKVNITGTALIYAGYIGGTNFEEGTDIAVDADGNAYVTGATASNEASFPAVGGPDLVANGNTDGFVVKVNAAGTVLVYAGFIGGANDDSVNSIALDQAGNAYIAGFTTSDQSTFPVTVGPDLTFNGYTDAFVAKVNASGSALAYAGYVGGNNADSGDGIAVDADGHAYLTGRTASDQGSFPVMIGPDLTYNGGIRDAFVTKINPAGTGLDFSGYIGGAEEDWGFGVAADTLGNAYITGQTSSNQATFPAMGGPDLIHNGNADAFVTKVGPGPAVVTNYPSGQPGSFFTISGSNFPPNSLASVFINGVLLTNTLGVDGLGSFTFLLDTASAEAGHYFATVSVNPSATAGFVLDPLAPLRLQSGKGPLFEVPAGIAFTNIMYLPLAVR